MGKRHWEPRECRMVAEFCAREYPGAVVLQRVRVGRITSEVPQAGLTTGEASMVGIWRRWADAIVVTQRRLIVIEGKVRPEPGVISQVELYMRLVPHTPELEEYSRRKLVGMIVVAIDDPLIRQMALERGLEVRKYEAAWLDDYILTLSRRSQQRGMSGGVQ